MRGLLIGYSAAQRSVRAWHPAPSDAGCFGPLCWSLWCLQYRRSGLQLKCCLYVANHYKMQLQSLGISLLLKGKLLCCRTQLACVVSTLGGSKSTGGTKEQMFRSQGSCSGATYLIAPRPHKTPGARAWQTCACTCAMLECTFSTVFQH